MLCKWIGAGMIMCMGVYTAMSMHRLEERRLTVLNGYISLLRYMKGRINCYAMPVKDIMETVDPMLLSACLGENRLNGKKDPPPITSLTDMLAASRLYMEPETERLLRNFIAEFGQTYRAEQVIRCEEYIQALNAEREKLMQTAPIRTRVSSALSLCTALGLAILLW